MRKLFWKVNSLVGNLFTKITMRHHVQAGKNTMLLYCDGHSIVGEGNKVIIDDSSQLFSCKFLISGNNNTIKIGKNCRMSKCIFWVSGDNNSIEIGDGTTSAHHTQFAALEGTRIAVGNDCMFSHDILVRTSDSHSIVDEQGNRINQSKDIIIGNHCWIGLQSLILKGSSLADNSVLAARSILNKQFEEQGCIIGGAPAKVLNKKINWDRRKL